MPEFINQKNNKQESARVQKALVAKVLRRSRLNDNSFGAFSYLARRHKIHNMQSMHKQTINNEDIFHNKPLRKSIFQHLSYLPKPLLPGFPLIAASD